MVQKILQIFCLGTLLFNHAHAAELDLKKSHALARQRLLILIGAGMPSHAISSQEDVSCQAVMAPELVRLVRSWHALWRGEGLVVKRKPHATQKPLSFEQMLQNHHLLMDQVGDSRVVPLTIVMKSIYSVDTRAKIEYLDSEDAADQLVVNHDPAIASSVIQKCANCLDQVWRLNHIASSAGRTVFEWETVRKSTISLTSSYSWSLVPPKPLSHSAPYELRVLNSAIVELWEYISSEPSSLTQ